jgi:hypothetical protein
MLKIPLIANFKYIEQGEDILFNATLPIPECDVLYSDRNGVIKSRTSESFMKHRHYVCDYLSEKTSIPTDYLHVYVAQNVYNEVEHVYVDVICYNSRKEVFVRNFKRGIKILSVINE